MIPDCEQILHLPVAKIEEQVLDTAVVFQAQPGRTAVLFFSKNAAPSSFALEAPPAPNNEPKKARDLLDE